MRENFGFFSPGLVERSTKLESPVAFSWIPDKCWTQFLGFQANRLLAGASALGFNGELDSWEAERNRPGSLRERMCSKLRSPGEVRTRIWSRRLKRLAAKGGGGFKMGRQDGTAAGLVARQLSFVTVPTRDTEMSAHTPS